MRKKWLPGVGVGPRLLATTYRYYVLGREMRADAGELSRRVGEAVSRRPGMLIILDDGEGDAETPGAAPAREDTREAVAAVAREVFGLTPLDPRTGAGVTEGEAVRLLADYLAWRFGEGEVCRRGPGAGTLGRGCPMDAKDGASMSQTMAESVPDQGEVSRPAQADGLKWSVRRGAFAGEGFVADPASPPTPRRIYSYTRDRQTVHADPAALRRALLRASAGPFDQLCAAAAGTTAAPTPSEGGAGSAEERPPTCEAALACEDAQEKLYAVTCAAFGLKPFDPATGEGATEGEAGELLNDFLHWLAER